MAGPPFTKDANVFSDLITKSNSILTTKLTAYHGHLRQVRITATGVGTLSHRLAVVLCFGNDVIISWVAPWTNLICYHGTREVVGAI